MYKKSSKVQGQSLLFPLITCNNNLTHAQIHTTNSAYLRLYNLQDQRVW